MWIQDYQDYKSNCSKFDIKFDYNNFLHLLFHSVYWFQSALSQARQKFLGTYIGYYALENMRILIFEQAAKMALLTCLTLTAWPIIIIISQWYDKAGGIPNTTCLYPH